MDGNSRTQSASPSRGLETRMKRTILSTAAAFGFLVSGSAAALANSPAQHDVMDATGFAFSCPSGTYTITTGSIAFVFHEGEAANGNTNFTVTERPQGVVLENGSGEEFALRGANWFGGTFNANTGNEVVTATHKMSIIGRGAGVVESFNMVERFRDGELVTVHFGSCMWP
jgi:hypothetical protein